MANLTEVQLPNGTTYKLVDDESGYITEAEVEGMIGDKADKTLVSYCSCSTAAATAQKEVVAPEGWVLESGRIIAVKFVNTNTAQNPTLKVGTADAKSIYYNNAVVTTGSLFAGGEADRVTLYIYDGTRFVWLGHSIDTNTTYSAMTASELTTGTATTLRTVRADYLKTGINNLISGKADKTDIATVESGTTASRAYSVGELVYVSGTLYRVKTAIASGATFTVGTNVEVTNVSKSRKWNNNYSENEHIVGTWIDGSILYEKTISCGAMPNNDTKQVPHNISNISLIVDVRGTTSMSNGTTAPLPYSHISDVRNQMGLAVDKTNIVLSTGSNRTGYTTTYVTLRYTKSA